MNICPTFSNTVAVKLQSCKFSSKKFRPTYSSYQVKNSLNNSKNINQNFFSKIWAKLYSCNSSQKKNRAKFSSYQVKIFGDYQPKFRAKWEQEIEFVNFPEKIYHCLLLIRSKPVCKKSTIFCEHCLSWFFRRYFFSVKKSSKVLPFLRQKQSEHFGEDQSLNL